MTASRSWVPHFIAGVITLALGCLGLGAIAATASVDAVSDTAAGDSHAVRSEDEVMIDPDPLRTDAEFLASERGIDPDVMEEYLRREMRLVSLAEQIDSAYHADIAGIWIDWRPDPVLVVRLTSAVNVGSMEAMSETLDSHVEFEVYVGEHSRADKIDLLTTLRQDLALAGFEQLMTHLDERSGDLVVTVPADEPQEDLLTRMVSDYATVHDVSIRIETTDARPHVATSGGLMAVGAAHLWATSQ